MRLTLISPYYDILAYGIRTLSSCLKKEGHDVKLVFLQNPFTKRYKERILKELVDLSKESDLIMISVMTNFFSNTVQITQALKELDIPILWGGIHPTIRPKECLNYADMVCIGEGEESLIELVRKMENGQEYLNTQGMWFKNNGKIIANKSRPLIQDLDSIPFQDYDYKTHYVINNGHICKMNKDLLKKLIEKGYVSMYTRGCPFGCTYCCNNTFNKMHPNQKLIRKRSVDNVIKELIEIKTKLPFIECIKFDDDSFFLISTKEMREFCEKYKENIGLPLFITGVAPTSLTKEKLSLLIDAGLTIIRMGIESGSERTRRLYKRHHSNQQIIESAEIINEFKDKLEQPPLYDIIMDNPWETDEDLIETLILLTKLPTPYILSLFSLTFYPGTELYEKAKKEHIINDDLTEVYNKHFHSCKKTYLNRLIFLQRNYANEGHKISTKLMYLLTNQTLRQSRLNWLLYVILEIGILPFRRKWITFLLRESLKDIRKGDLYRITKFIKNI